MRSPPGRRRRGRRHWRALNRQPTRPGLERTLAEHTGDHRADLRRRRLGPSRRRPPQRHRPGVAAARHPHRRRIRRRPQARAKRWLSTPASAGRHRRPPGRLRRGRRGRAAPPTWPPPASLRPPPRQRSASALSGAELRRRPWLARACAATPCAGASPSFHDHTVAPVARDDVPPTSPAARPPEVRLDERRRPSAAEVERPGTGSSTPTSTCGTRPARTGTPPAGQQDVGLVTSPAWVPPPTSRTYRAEGARLERRGDGSTWPPPPACTRSRRPSGRRPGPSRRPPRRLIGGVADRFTVAGRWTSSTASSGPGGSGDVPDGPLLGPLPHLDVLRALAGGSWSSS